MKKLFILLLTLCTTGVFAQVDVPFEKDFFKDDKDGLKEAKDNIKEGNRIFEGGFSFYRDAIPYYEKAQAFNPNNADLNFRLGLCYLYSVHKDKALAHLKKAEKINPKTNSDLYYYLGQAYHLEMEFQKAIESFTKYQQELQNDQAKIKDPYFDMKGTVEDLTMRINQCYNGKKLVESPIRVFIDNLGDNINTEYPEYGAVISADESMIVYTSRRPSTTGGKKDDQNEYFEDIFISYKQEDGSWSPAVNAPKPVNSDDHDAISGVSADGQKFIIYLGKSNQGDLFESYLEGDVWTKPESMGKNINTDFHEPSGCYSPDGRTLYFVSNKEGGLGEHDIYVSRMDEKGKWGKAENLGPSINTPYKDEGVYMHPDGKTMYFSSMGHNSMGGLDIFKTVYDASTNTWSKPENLGYPVNTTDDDVFFVISASGKHGYYTSAMKGSKGMHDLYMITFLGPEKPMILNNEDNLLASVAAPVKEVVIAPVVEVKEAQLTILKGVVTDFLTHENLEAEIEIVDNQANKVIATFKSNSKTGKYLVSLPAGKNYGIAVKKEGYLFHSENFDIPNTSAFQEVEKNIELKKLSVGTKIVLRNIFFDLDKATLRSESTVELNRLIKLMNDVPTLRIELGGHTDSQGSDTYNQQLSEKRAKAVVDYLTANGISASRLESAGYGETQLVNGCSNGVKCSDVQHQENRRTEFKVLSL